MKVPLMFFPHVLILNKMDLFFLSLFSPSLSLNVPHPVGRSANQLGPTESCGA